MTLWTVFPESNILPGKNQPIVDFLFTQAVSANISAREEYLLYRKALAALILERHDWKGIKIKQILHAREEGLELLRAAIH